MKTLTLTLCAFDYCAQKLINYVLDNKRRLIFHAAIWLGVVFIFRIFIFKLLKLPY